MQQFCLINGRSQRYFGWICLDCSLSSLAIINTKGRTNPLFCGLLLTLEWKKSKRNKEINKVVDFVWTSGLDVAYKKHHNYTRNSNQSMLSIEQGLDWIPQCWTFLEVIVITRDGAIEKKKKKSVLLFG